MAQIQQEFQQAIEVYDAAIPDISYHKVSQDLKDKLNEFTAAADDYNGDVYEALTSLRKDGNAQFLIAAKDKAVKKETFLYSTASKKAL